MANVDKGRLIRWLEVYRPTVVSSRWLACFFLWAYVTCATDTGQEFTYSWGKQSGVCVRCEYYMERLFICLVKTIILLELTFIPLADAFI